MLRLGIAEQVELGAAHRRPVGVPLAPAFGDEAEGRSGLTRRRRRAWLAKACLPVGRAEPSKERLVVPA